MLPQTIQSCKINRTSATRQCNIRGYIAWTREVSYFNKPRKIIFSGTVYFTTQQLSRGSNYVIQHSQTLKLKQISAVEAKYILLPLDFYPVVAYVISIAAFVIVVCKLVLAFLLKTEFCLLGSLLLSCLSVFL
jgi:uncharacterized membrane protein YkvA (DUF1232 family)